MSSQDPGTAEDIMDVARTYFDACNRRDVDAMEACWARGGVEQFPGVGELSVPDEWRPYFEGVFASFPDWRYDVLHTVAEGDLVAVHWRAQGTFKGKPYQGLEPNGARGSIQGIDLLRIEDGKIHRNDVYYDTAEFMRLLGLIPKIDSIGERIAKALFNLRTKASRTLNPTRRHEE
jgi:steroid delta-isomerase-like uncharacterized protein